MKKISILFIVALLFSCNERPVSETVAVAAKNPAPAPAHQPVVAVSNQPAEPLPPSNQVLSGTVLETMSAAGYTYLKVKSGSGDVWVAVPQAKVKKGAKVEVALQMLMENFESATLGRKFDRLAFATLVSGESAPVPAAVQHMSVPAPSDSISVEKAEGGRTVAEIWAAKSALGDQTVVVRGKVVKFLPEIMGKNWLHIRDGSGSRKEGDDDITVTTKEKAAVGDVVVVSGTLRVDKDFGAGYRYPVIIEEAKLRK